MIGKLPEYNINLSVRNDLIYLREILIDKRREFCQINDLSEFSKRGFGFGLLHDSIQFTIKDICKNEKYKI